MDVRFHERVGVQVRHDRLRVRQQIGHAYYLEDARRRVAIDVEDELRSGDKRIPRRTIESRCKDAAGTRAPELTEDREPKIAGQTIEQHVDVLFGSLGNSRENRSPANRHVDHGVTRPELRPRGQVVLTVVPNAQPSRGRAKGWFQRIDRMPGHLLEVVGDRIRRQGVEPRLGQHLESDDDVSAANRELVLGNACLVAKRPKTPLQRLDDLPIPVQPVQPRVRDDVNDMKVRGSHCGTVPRSSSGRPATTPIIPASRRPAQVKPCYAILDGASRR